MGVKVSRKFICDVNLARIDLSTNPTHLSSPRHCVSVVNLLLPFAPLALLNLNRATHHDGR
jgi:hypothetical protein